MHLGVRIKAVDDPLAIIALKMVAGENGLEREIPLPKFIFRSNVHHAEYKRILRQMKGAKENEKVRWSHQ